MFRVTSLTNMSEAQLNRLIKRFALLFLVVFVVFAGVYAIDRFRAKPAPIVDQRVTTLEEAVRKDPSDVKSRGELADLYFAEKRFDDAITQYTALIDAKKDVELAALGRGNAYRELQKYDLATADYQTVVSIGLTGEMANVDSSLEAAYYGLGVIDLAQSKPAAAVTQLLNATGINRTDADALNELGIAYTQNNQPDKAVVALGQAVSLVPVSWAEPYQNLAAAYTKLGKPELAAYASAMAMLESGDPTGAEAELKKLVTGPAAAEATVGLGILFEEKGDSASAAQWYAKSLAIDPSNESAQLGIKRVSGGDANASPLVSPSAASPSGSPAASASPSAQPSPAGSN